MWTSLYLWMKALHIISLVAWFAAMFYIWRLFVYHCENPHQEVKDQLNVMAEKLIRIIMTPAMVATLVFGFVLIYIQYGTSASFARAGWLHVKLLLVTVLLYIHFLAYRFRSRLESGETFASKKFRILNEVPTLILIAVVILAVLKPF